MSWEERDGFGWYVCFQVSYASFYQVVDPLLAGEDDGGVAMFRCVAVDKDNRPDAKEIAGDLKRIKNCTRLGEDDVAKD